MSDATYTPIKGPRPSQLVTRRDFLIGLLASIVAAMGLGQFVYPLYRYLSAAPKGVPRPMTIPLSELPAGAVKTIVYGDEPAIVMNRTNGIRAFSLVCTHLGCIVKWEPAKQQFVCPCHDGRFDKNGKVISGPPPIPLEQLRLRELPDQIIVGGT
ncbi:MAG: Rieske (2Fe-2S) protein [Chloroflexi bacterium]|nr:Rieske (2Fe-2S) protein [Chloroflexota bacterium]